jgi:hypothetical protein
MLTLSWKEFSSHYIHSSEPILITDGLSRWSATAQWSPEVLREMNPAWQVDVKVSRSGRWKYNPDGTPFDPESQYLMPNVPWRQAIDWITANQETPKYYISQVNLERFPELLADLHFPEIARSPITKTNFWFGSAGTVTPLHFDPAVNNLFAQVYGSKQFNLFAPDDAKYLYPFPRGSKLQHLSHVDVEDPDSAAFPLFNNASKISVTVGPGQLLFLPAFWWHHVKSLSVSISANYWFAPDLDQFCGPHAFGMLLAEFARDRWLQLSATLGLSVQSLLTSAENLLKAQSPVGILAVAVALNRYKKPGPKEPGAPLGRNWESLAASVIEKQGKVPREEFAPLLAEIQTIRRSVHRSATA